MATLEIARINYFVDSLFEESFVISTFQFNSGSVLKVFYQFGPVLFLIILSPKIAQI